MKKTCIMLAIVAFLCTACESNKTNVIEEKEPPTKVEEQQPEVEEKQEQVEEPEQKEEQPEEETVEEPQLTEQEKARQELVDKYGEDVVVAWEQLSRDEFFDYIGYELIIKEEYGPHGVHYYCYKILEDGTLQDAYVGGEYYIYGEYVSNEAIFDLVAYHNEFFS